MLSILHPHDESLDDRPTLSVSARSTTADHDVSAGCPDLVEGADSLSVVLPRLPIIEEGGHGERELSQIVGGGERSCLVEVDTLGPDGCGDGGALYCSASIVFSLNRRSTALTGFPAGPTRGKGPG
jgi:hypothetical protein